MEISVFFVDFFEFFELLHDFFLLFGQVAFPIYFPESSHVVSQLEAEVAPENGTMAASLPLKI